MKNLRSRFGDTSLDLLEFLAPIDDGETGIEDIAHMFDPCQPRDKGGMWTTGGGGGEDRPSENQPSRIRGRKLNDRAIQKLGAWQIESTKKMRNPKASLGKKYDKIFDLL